MYAAINQWKSYPVFISASQVQSTEQLAAEPPEGPMMIQYRQHPGLYLHKCAWGLFLQINWGIFYLCVCVCVARLPPACGSAMKHKLKKKKKKLYWKWNTKRMISSTRPAHTESDLMLPSAGRTNNSQSCCHHHGNQSVSAQTPTEIRMRDTDCVPQDWGTVGVGLHAMERNKSFCDFQRKESFLHHSHDDGTFVGVCAKQTCCLTSGERGLQVTTPLQHYSTSVWSCLVTFLFHR